MCRYYLKNIILRQWMLKHYGVSFSIHLSQSFCKSVSKQDWRQPWIGFLISNWNPNHFYLFLKNYFFVCIGLRSKHTTLPYNVPCGSCEREWCTYPKARLDQRWQNLETDGHVDLQYVALVDPLWPIPDVSSIPPEYHFIANRFLNLFCVICRWDYIEEGGKRYKDMNRLVAYYKGLTTWARWVDLYVDPAKTKIVFQDVSPTHYE